MTEKGQLASILPFAGIAVRLPPPSLGNRESQVQRDPVGRLPYDELMGTHFSKAQTSEPSVPVRPVQGDKGREKIRMSPKDVTETEPWL